MSAQFLIGYAGMYFNTSTNQVASATQATIFSSEADAWYAAYKADLNPIHCTVVSRDAALAKEAVK